MRTLAATVKHGRLVLDEATDLPEGSVVELVPADDDDLDAEERAALHAAMDRSLDDIEAGRTRPVQAILGELRTRR